jgi:hypothetical protein
MNDACVLYDTGHEDDQTKAEISHFISDRLSEARLVQTLAARDRSKQPNTVRRIGELYDASPDDSEEDRKLVLLSRRELTVLLFRSLQNGLQVTTACRITTRLTKPIIRCSIGNGEEPREPGSNNTGLATLFLFRSDWRAWYKRGGDHDAESVITNVAYTYKRCLHIRND